MKSLHIALLLAWAGMLAGCARPVPPDKRAYVGAWQQETMYLVITQDGSVRYKRLRNGGATSIDAPLKGFNGNDVEVGVGPMATTFVVSKPPYRDGDAWKMVVDGMVLTKSPY